MTKNVNTKYISVSRNDNKAFSKFTLSYFVAPLLNNSWMPLQENVATATRLSFIKFISKRDSSKQRKKFNFSHYACFQVDVTNFVK